MDEKKLVRAFIEENGYLDVDEDKLARAFLKHGWHGEPLYTSVVLRIIGEAIEQGWKESIPSKEEILKAISQGTKQAIGEAEGCGETGKGNSISSEDVEEAYQRWRGMGNG